jgi:hypothetical protein
MPRSKTLVSKLPRELRDPIEVAPPPLFLGEAEFKEWLQKRHDRILTEKLRKLTLLMTELKMPEEQPQGCLSQGRLLFLCLELAEKLYPGFQTTDEGAKRKGRPKRTDLFFGDPTILLKGVDDLQRQGLAGTDEDACRWFLEIEQEVDGKRSNRTELNRRAKSFASEVSRERKRARLRAAAAKLPA